MAKNNITPIGCFIEEILNRVIGYAYYLEGATAKTFPGENQWRYLQEIVATLEFINNTFGHNCKKWHIPAKVSKILCDNENINVHSSESESD